MNPLLAALGQAATNQAVPQQVTNAPVGFGRSAPPLSPAQQAFPEYSPEQAEAMFQRMNPQAAPPTAPQQGGITGGYNRLLSALAPQG